MAESLTVEAMSMHLVLHDFSISKSTRSPRAAEKEVLKLVKHSLVSMSKSDGYIGTMEHCTPPTMQITAKARNNFILFPKKCVITSVERKLNTDKVLANWLSFYAKFSDFYLGS